MTVPTRQPTEPVDNAPPIRSKVTGVLAALACAVGCVAPFLALAGALTAATAAVLQRTFIAVAVVFGVAAVAMWWMHYRRSARGTLRR